ncbi:hypothetical protein [uncultured Lentibacter sp.]|uniref:hypothetical protein n=1 Tax=uncultured Lentibacter sp. TaxID=1659309 RepID=UPI002627AAC1|nr:hypothetical protein [uncultured Lentibacter sp.]
MPHAELKYSSDLALDAREILRKIEALIQTRDPNSGACKGRAYPATEAHHSHVLLTVSLLPKAHRDAGFMAALLADLTTYIDTVLPLGTERSVSVSFSGPHYVTGKL